MKIHFFSDIHLEFGELPLMETEADVIVAAGDIAPGTRGLEWLQRASRPVIYVAGNHEFYSLDLPDTLGALRGQGNGHPVHFLENSSVEIGGVRFLGSTLWTNLRHADPHLMLVYQKSMNDFNQIINGNAFLTPEDTLAMHEHSLKWLQHQLVQPYQGKTVVVTHHAPSYQSWGDDAASLFQHAYCNDLDVLMKHCRIDLWIHGHVHHVSDYQCHRVRVVCNPRGYAHQNCVDAFEPAKIVEI